MRPFKTVRGLNPRRSLFDLSYSKLFTADLGILYPVMCDEVVPGDFLKFGGQMVIRFNPMVAPILHEINAFVHVFFVPYRLLWNEKTNEETEDTETWEEFITGGLDGNDASVLPRWTPEDAGTVALGGLWDMLGFPTGLTSYAGALPIDFPRRAYNFIYNEYYVDESVGTMVGLQNTGLLYRCWEKDYFTSAQLSQQRGTAPALPVTLTGSSQAVWDSAHFIESDPTGVPIESQSTAGIDAIFINNATARQNVQDMFNANTVDLSDGVLTSFDIADLRLAFQIQKWLERNQRGGARYTEFLRSHFGVAPRDDRLNRPEYIGGFKAPIIVSEVLQTSQTGTTPQGNLAGHGLSVSDSPCGKIHVQEYGLVMALLSIMPKPMYQQGFDRQWMRESKYDFFFPEFVNLSEQAILKRELYVTDGDEAENETIFGYQGRYDEMRVKRNLICGQMRTTFDYWHLARQFTEAPDLNEDFLLTADIRKDFLAAPSQPAMFIHYQNCIKAFRPLPILAEPGLIDHN